MAFDDIDDRSEEEEEVDEEEEEEEEESGRKRKASSLIEDAASEEDDEEEEADSHERNRGSYNPRVVRFIDDQVAVDDDEEEKDDDLSDADEDFEPDQELLESRPKPSQYHRYEASRDNLPEDSEAIEEMFKKRYERVEYTQETNRANEQSLVPTQLDPKLWMVQCRHGFEKSLCLQLMNKFLTYRAKGTPLLIKSAISLDHLKGFLYVEANKEAHVRDAVQGLNQVAHSKGIKLVPLEEMVDAIRPNRIAKMPIEIGSWVRIRSGPYASDLAQVINVNHASQKVNLKVIPRIDYTELANREEGKFLSRKRDPFGKKLTVRPMAKAFSSEECRSLGLIVESRSGLDGEIYMYVGNYCFQDGYLIKTMSTRSVIVEDKIPPLDELQRFRAAGQSNTDLGSGPTALPEVLESMPGRKHGLLKGDYVKILNGDLVGMSGTVWELLPDNMVSVRMENSELKDPLRFNPDLLAKHFSLGDHVRIHEGIHLGQLGVVIKTEFQKCLVLSDLDKKEFWVSTKSLSRTQESTYGYDSFGTYEVEDLVELQTGQFGVIILADKHFCRVLLASGSPEQPEIKKFTLQEIKCKVQTRKQTTNDKFSNRVSAGDIVDFTMWSKKKMSGTVKYVCNPFLFVKMKRVGQNLGYVVVPALSCMVRGGMNTAANNPRTASWNGGGRGNRGRYFLRGRGRGRFSQRGSVMVKVIKGAHRGFRGRVKDETTTHVRVELDAGSKIINLPKDNVECLDNDPDQKYSGNQGYNDKSSTSWNWGNQSASGDYGSERGTGSGTGGYGMAPKTPYGENHPPTTPYLSRDTMTSPKYTPIREPAKNAEIKETRNDDDSDSDDDMRFEQGEQRVVPPPMPASQPVPDTSGDLMDITSPGKSPMMDTDQTPDEGEINSTLSQLPERTRLGLIVKVPSGAYGVAREMKEEGKYEVELVSMKTEEEHRVFALTGEKESYSSTELSLLIPEKNDWVRVLQEPDENAVGRVVAFDAQDFIVRLKDDAGKHLVRPGHSIAVALPPSPN